MARHRTTAWSFSVGPYGCRVRAFERTTGSIWLQIRLRGQPPRLVNLHHRDRTKATDKAKERQAELALGLAGPKLVPSLGATLDAFATRQGERVADLRAHAVADTEREVTFWKAALGADADPTTLTQDDLERVMRKRKSGALDARGQAVPVGKRRAVRTRTVGADLEFLRACLRWATLKKRLFRENVMAGFAIPEEPNPRRPVATAERYEKTRAVADSVTMEIRGQGKRETVPSWLPELLDLAYATGRRIGAIAALRYTDVSLDATKDAPLGAIRWPADTDKMGREWQAPISQLARSALDRVLVDREIGVRARWPESPWLFPSPRNAGAPLAKDLASAWLEDAEARAELPKLDGSLWHAYRRGWATARKQYPLADVAAAGGWKDTTTLRTAYSQADPATTRRVILDAPELHDGGG